jgi:hypothetical protein
LREYLFLEEFSENRSVLFPSSFDTPRHLRVQRM